MNLVGHRMGLLIALLSALSPATPSLACSLVNVEASMANAVSVSGYYFGASIMICLILAGLDVYEKRLSIPLILSVLLVIFHPWRTVAPLYGPDCSFLNVEASQVALVALIGMLAFRVLRLRKRLAARKSV